MKKIFDELLQLNLDVPSNKEKKRIILVNGLTLMGTTFSLIFIGLDLIQQLWEPLWGMIGFIACCLSIYFLNRNKYYASARTILVFISFAYFFLNANFLFTGKLAEFFYLGVLLMVMLFTDNFYIQLSSLLLSMVAFYVPNIYLELYPEEVFGYANMSVLFIGLFLTIRHFIVLNERNERQLQLDNQIIENQNTRLENLQKLQEQFFINISHEIRTPLTIINGHLNRINKADQEYKEGIKEQTEKITGLLDDLIDLSRIDSGKLSLTIQPTNLSYLISKSFYMFESYFEDLEIDFDIELPENDIWANVDEKYFERSLLNLIHNASKYTNPNGKVLLKLISKENHAIIEIIDSGRGIHADSLNTIFDRFTQLEPSNEIQGTGVGLNFVKQCMELMRGNVEVESTYGKGSVFRLIVPVTDEQSTSNKLPTTKVALKPNLSMLLVDDNEQMRTYLKDLFQEQTVFTAKNGLEALHILTTQQIDCVITDFMMPVMDGLELLTNIRDKGYDCSVIILTAKTDSNSKLSALRLGVDDYLQKPFNEEELLLRVNTLTSNRFQREIATNKIETNTFSQPDHRNYFLDQLQEIISREPDLNDFKISDLAEQLHISNSTLLRNIKNHTGLTSKQYIKEVGLQRARKFYEQNQDITIKALAQEAGIKNQTYFSQEFYNRFGINLRK